MIEGENWVEEHLLKLAIVGTETIEKEKVFRSVQKYQDSDTLGVDITTQIVDIKDRKVKLILVDTKGDRKFEKLRPEYYRGAEGILLVFSFNNMQSFRDIPRWIKEIEKSNPENVNKIRLIGIKGGNEVVLKEEIDNLSSKYDLKYFEYAEEEKKGKFMQLIARDII